METPNIEFKVNISPKLMREISKNKDLKMLASNMQKFFSSFPLGLASREEKLVEESLRHPIKEIDISARAKHALIQEGLVFLDQLSEYTESKLVSIKGISQETVDYIKTLVSLKEEDKQADNPFAEVGFPTKLQNLLMDLGYKSVDDLKQESKERILAIKGIGKKSRELIFELKGLSDYQQGKRKISISKLGFSTKIVKALERAGIKTEAQLLRYKVEKLRSLKGIGPNSFVELKNFINRTKVEEKDILLSEIDIAPRTLTALNSEGILSLNQLRLLSFERLKNLNGVGKHGLKQVLDIIYDGEHMLRSDNTDKEDVISESSDNSSVEKQTSPKDTDKKIETSILLEDKTKEATASNIESEEENAYFEIDITNEEGYLHRIDILNIPKQIKTKLNKNKILFVEDLNGKSKKEITNLRGLNAKSVIAIEQALEDFFKSSEEYKSEYLDKNIKNIGLEKRITDVLIDNGIQFLNELKDTPLDKVKEMDGIGNGSFKAIREKLEKIA